MDDLLMRSIMKTGNAVRRYVDRQAERAGVELGGPHMRILGYLVHHAGESLCQKDIEGSFALARSTVSGILTDMEKWGFIRREPVPGDARLKRVLPTELAHEFYAWIREQNNALEAVVAQNFTQEEKEQFVVFLERVLSNLKREAPGAGG